jgi:hypothetical protein
MGALSGYGKRGDVGWFIVTQILSVVLELIMLCSRSDANKDLEILLLRRQLALVERKLDKPLRVSRAEKMPWAVLANKLKTGTGQTARQMKRVMKYSNRKLSSSGTGS